MGDVTITFLVLPLHALPVLLSFRLEKLLQPSNAEPTADPPKTLDMRINLVLVHCIAPDLLELAPIHEGRNRVLRSIDERLAMRLTGDRADFQLPEQCGTNVLSPDRSASVTAVTSPRRTRQ